MSSGKKADWSPDQYLLFKQARGRAIDDLIAYLGRSLPAPPSRIIDLGCGPGNSTKSLLAQFPNANVSGLDSSPAMIAAAQRALPNLKFTLADLSSYDPPVSSEEPTLLFSNAVFHWLRRDHRIPTISRLLRSLEPNGVLAFQVPDNFDEPSHRAMRETAYSAEFASYFSGANGKPELDPIESAAEYYDALTRDAAHVEIWRTEYQHVLTDHGEIVEWVRGTGLMPFLDRLPEEDDGPDGGEVRKQFLNEYRKRLEKSYGILKDGKVMLTYPRLFVVAFRA